MTPQQEVERGERARRILEDELYINAFSVVKDYLMRKWSATDLQDVATREQLFLQVGLLDKLKSTLEFYLQNGKVAYFGIEQEKRRKNVK